MRNDAAFAFKHLILISGASGVGKSTLLKQIEASATLRARLDIPDGRYVCIESNKPENWPSGTFDTVAYHYDILRPFNRPMGYRDDPGLSILQEAGSVELVVLVRPAQDLRDRMLKRVPNLRARLKQTAYADKDFLPYWYQCWLNEFEKLTAGKIEPRFFMSTSDLPELTKKELFRVLSDPTDPPGPSRSGKTAHVGCILARPDGAQSTSGPSNG
jgi:hypothetical protein